MGSRKKIDEDHVFMLLVIIWEYAWKMHQSRARENYRKTFRKTSYQWRFRGVGKQSTNFLFFWHLPFAILQENARQMQRSRAWENYRITFRKTSYTIAFSWSRKTIDKHHVFMAFTIGNSARKTLGKCSDRALGKT